MEKSSRLWSILGICTAILTLPVAYLILRFSPSPHEVAAAAVGTLLVALTAFGYIGTKRGNAAPFVAIALLLPYLLIATVAYAGLQRTASEIGSIFEGDDESSIFEESDESADDEGDTYGSNPALDRLQDNCVAGDEEACNDLYREAPIGSEYEATAAENGGGLF